jgi:hypothetical protein
MNYFKIPFACPIKFVPSTTNPGIHFDDDIATNLIRSFERKVNYYQKWVKADHIILQCESTIAPARLQLYNAQGVLVKEVDWLNFFVGAGVSYGIYQADLEVTDVPDGVYYLYTKVGLLSVSWPVISNPIHIKSKWPGTALFKYRNSFNDFDVAWSTGIEMLFRCEAAIMEFQPVNDVTTSANQLGDLNTLKAVPSRSFKLFTGTAIGHPPYITDILNRILSCDYVNIDGQEFQLMPGAKWEMTRAKGYPFVGSAIDIAPAHNNMSLEFADTNPLSPGIIAAYNIETGFFGPGTLIPILDV